MSAGAGAPPKWIALEANDRQIRVVQAEAFEPKDAGPSAEEVMVGRIVDAVPVDGIVETKVLAAAVGRDADDGTFKRALRRALDEGRLRQVARGQYSRPAGQASGHKGLAGLTGPEDREAA